MLYIVDNNGTYGLTKGQFSATNDKGSTSKKGLPNLYEPIDVVSHGPADRGEFRRSQLLRATRSSWCR